MKIGVLALQGAVSEHLNMLKSLGVEAIPVKTAEEIKAIDGLIMPGGESTTMGRLITKFELENVIKERINEGMPVYGTCAGMILLSKRIKNYSQFTLGILDITVIRNAFGRQIDSMEVDLHVKGLDDSFHAIFIRAPIAVDLGTDVEALASLEEGVVFLRQGNVYASAFHPELGNDPRIHKMFIESVEKFLNR
ncbi:pyridoxal 5'-phosphate synthase glutaminase subunit PdxT [Caldisericum exile]|uniref:Pyridoxal 5'-phosphate synthase subunit PdxT n=1 Tax=Caldisericum exile (strain DSM 21853 / NBRC 104410 / AZM16c01) TaxID=511051 RepID=A0A7U6GF34_CALEA|nr:pyridoxal 5'-phosphate synthase glutaminase subunit PdxT [Caldisericum exile]BAL81209.1 glutamine amidotransferase subunit PdxT [Caldisericum exile AZM16c01]